jgi:DNA polymerase III epsilon subunit-like protein
MLLAITDVETGGLDPSKDPCIEVAVVLYDAVEACVIEAFSSLIRSETNDAVEINRIPLAALRKAPAAQHVWARVEELAGGADAFAAHNAPFDASFYPSWLSGRRPWIDTKQDLSWKRGELGDKLVVLALAHDLGVSHAHRAMVDCDLIARLLTRNSQMGHGLVAFLQRGLRPKATFLSLAPFEKKDVVKAAGFNWFPEKKSWMRTMAIEDAAALPFAVRQVG